MAVSISAWPIASRIRVELTDTSSSRWTGISFKMKSLPLLYLFQQVVISLAALAEAMVIADDHSMRMEIFQQEILIYCSAVNCEKASVKGHDHEVIDLLPGQELDLFFQRIDQPDFFRAAPDDLAGVGIKGNDHGFAADTGSLLSQLLQDLCVTGMYAVESTDGDHCLTENRQLSVW